MDLLSSTDTLSGFAGRLKDPMYQNIHSLGFYTPHSGRDKRRRWEKKRRSAQSKCKRTTSTRRGNGFGGAY